VKVAVYARTSTTDQHNEPQVRELTEHATRRGWGIAAVYQDQISGAKTSRPALDRLMADARRRKFDAVVVTKLDRFGRSLLHCVGCIQQLKAAGVRFVAVDQNIDSGDENPASELLMHILAACAQFERALIRERVRAGIEHARRCGRRLGRPKKEVDPERARKLRKHGMTIRAVAAKLHVSVGLAHRLIAGT
jgi:DNA invertase Pin-like site-specific DNA recombinase